MKKLIASTILLWLSGISYSFAVEPVKITVDNSNPPFMYSTGGEAAGLYPTLVEAVFQHMKISVAIKSLPWKRALMNADQGYTGIAGIYKNAERLKSMIIPKRYFRKKWYSLYLRKRSSPIKKSATSGEKQLE